MTYVPFAVIFVINTSTTKGNIVGIIYPSGYVILITGGYFALFLSRTPYDVFSKFTLMSIANTIHMSIYLTTEQLFLFNNLICTRT